MAYIRCARHGGVSASGVCSHTSQLVNDYVQLTAKRFSTDAPLCPTIWLCAECAPTWVALGTPKEREAYLDGLSWVCSRCLRELQSESEK